MEIPTPSSETIGKFFGGLLITITAGWMIIKKLLKLLPEESVEYPTLRRSEDTGTKAALDEVHSRVTRLEDRMDRRFIEERSFVLDQIQESERRLSTQVSDIGKRLDDHHQGLNERLDILLKK